MTEARISRRGIVPRLVAAAAAGGAAFSVQAKEPLRPRVAYHLSDREKVVFALGNIANHFDGMGGPDKVEIVLVVNGPALAAFKADGANPDLQRRLNAASGSGVRLEACGNTLDAQKLSLADLLPGFVRVDQGGVVRLHQLQMQGYAYIRP